MTNILLDSNVIIALAKGILSTSVLDEKRIRVSEMNRLEVFGYHKLSEEENNALSRFFENIICLEISVKIIDGAIALRQANKMSVGDAIIAATALRFDLRIYTANIDDFKHIQGLNYINPFKI